MYPIRNRACALIVKDEKILLVEMMNEDGLHYNLPAGGVEAGESIEEAVAREALEEAGVEVEVGPLAALYQYMPHLSDNYASTTPSINFIFHCHMKEGSIARMPAVPDEHQVGVRWVPLDELTDVPLHPRIQQQLLDALASEQVSWTNEHDLPPF